MDSLMEISENLTFIGCNIMELTSESGFLPDPPEEDKCWVVVPEI